MTQKLPWISRPPTRRYARTWRAISVVAAVILWPIVMVGGLAAWVWLQIPLKGYDD